MSSVAYCYFKTKYQAEQFKARLSASFKTSEPYITDTPYQSRSVIVEVHEHDGSEMGTRTFATMLAIVNLYDGIISDMPESRPEQRASTRPGGAPFSGPLPDGIVDETGTTKTAASADAPCTLGEKGCNQATHQYCPASGGQRGQDNTTHSLVNRAKGMTCRNCGQTQKQIESGPINPK